MISHTKEFGVYHWDTFDNETILMDQFDKIDQAIEYIKTKYQNRISVRGADKVDIVNSKGIVVKHYSIT